jgi:hypothetical protein
VASGCLGKCPDAAGIRACTSAALTGPGFGTGIACLTAVAVGRIAVAVYADLFIAAAGAVAGGAATLPSLGRAAKRLPAIGDLPGPACAC